MHPLRLQYELFSDANPLMAFGRRACGSGPRAIESRWPAKIRSSAMQENMSHQIVAALDAWREATEKIAEQTFLAVYGAPTLQAAVGVDPAANRRLAEGDKEPVAP